jgi:uncharacterized phage protein (TIGR02216 family)
MTQEFPWTEVMRFGLHHLKLSPRDFWNSTLRELVCGSVPTERMPRQYLNHLMELHPDEPES